METHESKGYLKLQLDPSPHLYPSPLLYYPPERAWLSDILCLCFCSVSSQLHEVPRCPAFVFGSQLYLRRLS